MPVLNRIDYIGTENRIWRSPDLEDFGYGSNWEDLPRYLKMDVVSHFLVTTGTDKNPPKTYSQLKLPVINPKTSMLNKRAIDNAKSRLSQTKGIYGVRNKLNKKINKLQELYSNKGNGVFYF